MQLSGKVLKRSHYSKFRAFWMKREAIYSHISLVSDSWKIEKDSWEPDTFIIMCNFADERINFWQKYYSMKRILRAALHNKVLSAVWVVWCLRLSGGLRTQVVSSPGTNIIKLIIHCSSALEAPDCTLTTVYWETHCSSVAPRRQMKSIPTDSPSPLKPINDNHCFPFVHYDLRASIKKVSNIHFQGVCCGDSVAVSPWGSQQEADIIRDKWTFTYVTIISVDMISFQTSSQNHSHFRCQSVKWLKTDGWAQHAALRDVFKGLHRRNQVSNVFSVICFFCFFHVLNIEFISWIFKQQYNTGKSVILERNRRAQASTEAENFTQMSISQQNMPPVTSERDILDL